MTLEQAQEIINTKYPSSKVVSIEPNGTVVLQQPNGRSYTRLSARDFASMKQKAAHLAERPEQPKLDEFTMNAILIEKYGEAGARRHPKWTQMTEEPQQQQDTSGLLPSEIDRMPRGLPSNQNRAKEPKLPSDKW